MSISTTEPLCLYHPVKTLFLDDNQAFLNALSLEFGSEENMIMLTDPDEAMLHIKQSRNDSFFKVNRKGDSNKQEESLLNILYDNVRFDNVAVLVVDYEMPKINGIKFCENLKDKNIFKILLTAEADKDIAIKAFNNGTIDKFILKTNDDLYTEILTSIKELTARYFSVLSKISLHIGGERLQSLLHLESYIEIFNEVLIKSKAIEYYLIDQLGSFLFLSPNADPTWLIVSDQSEANEQVDLLTGYEFEKSIIKKIKKNEAILFLYSDVEYKKSASEWEKYIFPSKKIDDNYCYAVIHSRLTDSIRWNDVVSYDKNSSLCSEWLGGCQLIV